MRAGDYPPNFGTLHRDLMRALRDMEKGEQYRALRELHRFLEECQRDVEHALDRMTLTRLQRRRGGPGGGSSSTPREPDDF